MYRRSTRTKALRIAVATGMAGGLAWAGATRTGAATTGPPPPAAPAVSARAAASAPPGAVPTVSAVAQLEQITGPAAPNETAARWDVAGTDLGEPFWYEGSLYLVFGDTLGAGGRDWRSNTMARLDPPDPAAGLRIASMVTGPTGAAAQLLSSMKVDGVEKTVIPTYGLSVGTRMYLHYMSVRRWLTPGRWQVNYSGLAYSDDGGRTWVKDRGARWSGTSNFAQVAMVDPDGQVYLFGIPAGRFGGVEVARVPEQELLRVSDYTYWDGTSWSPDPSAAVSVVPAPAGELSVQWSSYLHEWMMTYLDESRGAVVLRVSSALTGPWSNEVVVTTSARFPELYAPFLLPIDTGADVYFTMSQYGPYAVYLMKMHLSTGG